MTIETLTRKLNDIFDEKVKVTLGDQRSGDCFDLPDLVSRYEIEGLGNTYITLVVTGRESRYHHIANCSITTQPGCCGMAAITGLMISHHDNRRKGIGTLILTFMEELASLLDYGAVIATDIEGSNGPLLLESCNWKRHSFSAENPRSNNTLLVFTKEL